MSIEESLRFRCSVSSDAVDNSWSMSKEPVLCLPGPAFSYRFDGDFSVRGTPLRIHAEGGQVPGLHPLVSLSGMHVFLVKVEWASFVELRFRSQDKCSKCRVPLLVIPLRRAAGRDGAYGTGRLWLHYGSKKLHRLVRQLILVPAFSQCPNSSSFQKVAR